MGGKGQAKGTAGHQQQPKGNPGQDPLGISMLWPGPPVSPTPEAPLTELGTSLWWILPMLYPILPCPQAELQPWTCLHSCGCQVFPGEWPENLFVAPCPIV